MMLEFRSIWRGTGGFESISFFLTFIAAVEEVETSPFDVCHEGIDTANEVNEILLISWNWDVLKGIIELDLLHAHDTESAQ